MVFWIFIFIFSYFIFFLFHFLFYLLVIHINYKIKFKKILFKRIMHYIISRIKMSRRIIFIHFKLYLYFIVFLKLKHCFLHWTKFCICLFCFEYLTRLRWITASWWIWVWIRWCCIILSRLLLLLRIITIWIIYLFIWILN